MLSHAPDESIDFLIRFQILKDAKGSGDQSELPAQGEIGYVADFDGGLGRIDAGFLQPVSADGDHRLREVNLLLFDRSHEALGTALFPGCSYVSHADLRAGLLQHLRVGSGCILDALIRVMDLRRVIGKRPLDGRER